MLSVRVQPPKDHTKQWALYQRTLLTTNQANRGQCDGARGKVSGVWPQNKPKKSSKQQSQGWSIKAISDGRRETQSTCSKSFYILNPQCLGQKLVPWVLQQPIGRFHLGEYFSQNWETITLTSLCSQKQVTVGSQGCQGYKLVYGWKAQQFFTISSVNFIKIAVFY